MSCSDTAHLIQRDRRLVANLTDCVEKLLDGDRLLLGALPFSTTSSLCATANGRNGAGRAAAGGQLRKVIGSKYIHKSCHPTYPPQSKLLR